MVSCVTCNHECHCGNNGVCKSCRCANCEHPNALDDFYKNLSVKTNIKLLSERTYLYPKDSMLNSEYHLNSKGRKDRSIKVSKDLAITLKQPIRNIKNSFLITNEIKKKFENTYK